MAKKQPGPNAELIAALQPVKPIPYDPELRQAIGAAVERSWNEMLTIMYQAYRQVRPDIWLPEYEAEKAGDAAKLKAARMQADSEWSDATGLPPITSWHNLQIVMAIVSAAGYPETSAGLCAWVIQNTKSRHTPSITFSPNAERDKWLYEQATAGTPWKNIAALLDQHDEWESLSISGIRLAARRYAERHHLPSVPQRRRGRPER